MAFVLSDRIKETTTTTSTGTYTLGGAVSGFETFTANLSNGDTTYYCCTDGTDFEVGLGTFASSGTTLARTTIISSSNSNNAVNWSSGSRDIFCTLPGSKAVFKDGDGHASFADDEKVKFGSDNDGYLRHTGSIFQLISDTGGLNLKTNADNQDVIIQTDDGSGGTTDYLRADGSSGAVKLSHYGSTKLETTSGGVTITGALTGNVTGNVTGNADTASAVAADNISAGDAAINLTTTSGNITIDAQGSDTDIIFKGTDGSSDITALTLDMSDAGAATFNHDLTANGNILAEDGYVGFGNQSADNWGKIEFLGSDPTGFTSQFDNAVAIVNEQGSTNQRIFVFDTSLNQTSDLFGVSSQGQAVFSITGQGNLTFKRPNNDTTHDVILACSTPTAARTVTLPDATGTVALTSDITVTASSTTTFTNKTLTSPKINEDVAVTATATEINKLDGVTATTTELNYVDVTTLGTVEASKAVTADANGDVVFPDNEKLNFGTGSDLEIFDDGSISRIQADRLLYLKGTGINFYKAGSSELMASMAQDGAVELYHDNSKKFETTSDGATVTGDLTVTSTDAGSQEDPSLILYRNSSSPADSDEIAEILFRGRNDNSQDVDYSKITGHAQDVSDGTEDAYMRFFTKVGGTDQMHIQLGFGTTDIFGRMRLTGNSLTADPSIIFEGQTANANETELKVTDPTADRTITFPDATGTVLTTGNSDTPTTTTSSSDADFVLVDDGGTMKKITPSNLGITSGGASKGFAVAMAIAL